MANLPPTPYEAPKAPAPKATPILRYLLLGAGGVLLFAVTAIGSCALLIKRVGDTELQPVVDAYFAKVRQGDYAGAYADFGAPMHAATSEPTYVAFEQNVHARLGQVEQSAKVVNVQTGVGSQGTWAMAVYDTRFDKGDARLTFRFQKEGERWRIVGVNYNAPTLLDALKVDGADGG